MGDVKGWSHPGEFELLGEFARESVGPMMEIGSYAGRSALVLGAVAAERKVELFCVDHHRGSPEMRPGRDCHDPEMIRDDGRHDSLPSFRRNVADAGLEGSVTAIVSGSERVAKWWSLPLGLLFIDGGHDAETVMHDYLWFQRFVRDGFLAFHDATDGNIGEAVGRALDDGWGVRGELASLKVLAHD